MGVPAWPFHADGHFGAPIAVADAIEWQHSLSPVPTQKFRVQDWSDEDQSDEDAALCPGAMSRLRPIHCANLATGRVLGGFSFAVVPIPNADTADFWTKTSLADFQSVAAMPRAQEIVVQTHCALSNTLDTA
jgi:hypothetical protein